MSTALDPTSAPIDSSSLGKPIWGLVFGLILGCLPAIVLIAMAIGLGAIPAFGALSGWSAFGPFGMALGWASGMAAGIALMGTLTAGLGVFIPLGATIAGLLHANSAASYAGTLFRLSAPSTEDDLGQRVLRLSEKLGLPAAPGIMWIDGDVANAFAMGVNEPGKSIVAIGAPFRSGLNSDEIDAVIGHELGHIVYNDAKRTMYFRSFQNWLGFIFVFYRLKVIARWCFTTISEMAFLAHSREREYHADAIGAALTSKEAMISALEKIHNMSHALSKVERRYAALMFRSETSSLFSTHPSMRDRIAALQQETYLRQIPRRKKLIHHVEETVVFYDGI